MEFSIPIYKHHDDLTIKNSSNLLSSSLKSSTLNILLTLVICIFTLCLLHLIRHNKEIPIIQTNSSTIINNTIDNDISIPHKTHYYDYEPYLNNNTSEQTKNQTRRFYYIDLGCFDGRDIDYFLYFHHQEISRFGKSSIIAFEPDPINYSACKFKQNISMSLTKTVYDAAVWTSNGKVRFATERGQKSMMDENSALYVRSMDFSQWLLDNFSVDDFIYVKFSIEGAEIAVLEKMILDESLLLVDYLEIEWNHRGSTDYEVRRIYLECMFDNFGMDFLYAIDPVDLKHAYNVNDTYVSVPKDRIWKMSNSITRFHYKTRKEVSTLLAERLKRK